MKILQINTVCTGTSTGTICTQLAQHVSKNGGECIIAFGRGDAVPSVECMRIEKQSEFLAHSLLARLTDRQGFFSVSATRKFCDFIRAYNPDIVHLHNLHGYYLNIELLFQTLAEIKKPVLMTLHDCWTFTGRCAYNRDCDKWKTGCGHCPRLSAYPKAWIDRSARNYKNKQRIFTLIKDLTVVTPSHWLAGLVKESFLGKYPVKVIPNGIDLSVFKPTESDFRAKNGIGENEKIALGVANFRDPNKGFDDFLSLAHDVPDCRFVLVGLSEKQVNSLPEGILGLCRVKNPQELAKIYSAADVFVNPTYADNFPTVNLEALACGVPVVTYDVGGSTEAIKYAEGTSICGTAVAAGDRKALAEAVRKSLLNPPPREQCQKQASAYDKNDRFEDYLRLYTELKRGTAK